MLEPLILIDCGHTFCKSCVTTLKQNGQHCGNCRKPIVSSSKPNFTVKQVVLNIPAQCDDCHKKDKIEVLVKHKCPQAEIQCSNEGCSQKIKRKDKRTHEEECFHRVISCTKCHKETTVANEEVHMEQLCPEGVISCPLNCRKRPKRYDCKDSLSKSKNKLQLIISLVVTYQRVNKPFKRYQA